jgi:phosphatidylglycerol:prolipoprotein diacylglycerol transferase
VCQTLFYIPHEIFGLPLFGWGLGLVLWAIAAAIAGVLLWRRTEWRKEIRDSAPFVVVVAAAIVFLLPRLEVRAADGSVLGLPIRGYGLMLLLGVLSGVGLTIRLARSVGIAADVIYSLAFWMFGAGIIGARVFYVIQYWPSFYRDTLAGTLAEVLKFTEGGLVVFGAIAGGLIAFWAFATVRRLNRLMLADVIVPGMALGLAFGRIGCLLNGCCFGAESHWAHLAVTFPHYSSVEQLNVSPPYWHQLSTGRFHGFSMSKAGDGVQVVSVEPGSAAEKAGLKSGVQIASISGRRVRDLADARQLLGESGPEVVLRAYDNSVYRWTIGDLPKRSLPVHPTQLYSAINAALLWLLLCSLFQLRPRDGVVFAVAMTIYPITRFLLEMIRDDEPGRFGTPLTISQLASLLSLALVACFWLYLIRSWRAGGDATFSGHAA